MNINKTYPASILGFVCYPHKNTCVIMSEYLVSHKLQASSSKNKGVILRHINKVKSIHDIVLPKNCGYKNCGEKTCFNVRAMYAQYYFGITVLNNILHHFLLEFLLFFLFTYFGRRYNKDNKI